MEIEIVCLGVFRARTGVEIATRHTERRQQLLPYFGSHLRLQRDQILSRRRDVGLPQKLVAFHLN